MIIPTDPFSSFLVDITIPEVLGTDGGRAVAAAAEFVFESLVSCSADEDAEAEAAEVGLASVDFLPITLKTEEAIELSLRPKLPLESCRAADIILLG